MIVTIGLASSEMKAAKSLKRTYKNIKIQIFFLIFDRNVHMNIATVNS